MSLSIRHHYIADKAEKDFNKLDNVRGLFNKLYLFIYDFGEIRNGTAYFDEYPVNAGAPKGKAKSVVEVNIYL